MGYGLKKSRWSKSSGFFFTTNNGKRSPKGASPNTKNHLPPPVICKKLVHNLNNSLFY